MNFDDPLPIDQPRRFTVAGPSGSGKSSLARTIAARLEIPYVELDALYHGPEWTVRETWQEEVLDFIAGPEWAIEWQGEEVREQMTGRAQVLVWLDHSRVTVTSRVVRRTVRRRFGGSPLPNGLQEGPLRTFFTDPDHIIKWSWRYHEKIRNRVKRVIAEDNHPGLVIVRLRGQREVDAWLRGPFAAATSSGEPQRR
ncbi:(d)CMP kinase [Amycolatopsis sp. NPDC003731]